MESDTLILLNNINKKLYELIIKIDDIDNRLKIIDERTSKVDYHVDFTVEVYNTVKKPMNFFTNALNKYIGISSIKLPELNHITNNQPNNESKN